MLKLGCSLAALVLVLLVPLSSAQFRFVAQLSVSGIGLFVHDSGAPNGPHFAVEPLMYVTESLSGLLPRYDPVTQQTYVSVRVRLRDDALLAEVKYQLRHFSPKSVRFATVSDVNVSTGASSPIQALGFDWTQDETTGVLRIGCPLYTISGRSFGIRTASNCSITNFIAGLENRQPDIFAHLGIKLIASFREAQLRVPYQVVMRSQLFFDQNAAAQRYQRFPTCPQLRHVSSIRFKNCIARVHQKAESFFIEPLMCYDGSATTSKSVMFDDSRDMHYLKLDIALQDDLAIYAVINNLDIPRRSISFMRVWQARSHVVDALRRRFEFSDLMVSGDWRSGQVRVYCKHENDCNTLREELQTNAYRFLRHIRWLLSSLVEENCIFENSFSRYLFGAPVSRSNDYGLRRIWMDSCWAIRFANPRLNQCLFSRLLDGRKFVLIQQRVSGSVSFRKEWTDYANGFGDENNFWIGLETMHLLSIKGSTLRVEMKLWNGSDLHAEYSGVKVGSFSTQYRLTYLELVGNASSVSDDSMVHQNGAPFSTVGYYTSIAYRPSDSGQAGWWFSDSDNRFNPNGIYPQFEYPLPESPIKYITWGSFHLREIRLMLQL